MQPITRKFLGLSAALIFSVSVAHAQLLLSGHTTGSFDDLGQPNTTVNNAPDGSWANFRTGIAASGSTQSSIEFANASFSNVGSGQPIQVGLFNIRNGMTLIGSGQHTAMFNLGLQLTSPEWQTLAINTITFHIDHTPNIVGAIPDTFSVSFEQPAPIKIQDTWVQFHVNVDPLDFQIAENATVRKGDITVSFTPVPEPGTYALAGSVMLLGLAAYRRARGRRLAQEVQMTA